jgi:hypothetical protein
VNGPFPWIAAAWLALSIRGLAPVASFGGWKSLLLLEALALAACLIPAWRFRRSSTERVLRDPATFLLLAHFPIWAMSYFVVGANHGVDAIDHLEFVRSVVFDHDLDIRNDDAVFGGGAEQIDPGQINMHGVGPAMLWTPLYVIADALCGTIGQSCNGASRPYLAACTLTSMMASAWGLVVAFRLILPFAPRGPAFLAILGVAWGTFLWWYMTIEPTMSHNLSFASSALAFLLMYRAQASGHTRGWFVAGLVVGYTASIRFADALIGAAAFPFILLPSSPRAPRERLKDALALFGGASLGFAPQMYAWFKIFGQPLVIPHGGNFLEHGSAYLDVLFSPQSGLFTWSPLLYLALPGLFAIRRLGWRFMVGAWTALLLVYATNARAHWWAGAGFGARRFCTVLPLLAIGLAITFDALSRFVKQHPLLAPSGIVAAFATWNLLLAEGHRQEAWVWDGPVSFSQMARVSADLVDRRVGSPFSGPGALWESLRNGQPLTEYESAMFRRTASRFTLRFGDGDLPYLGTGFSVPQSQGDDLHRSTRDGFIEVLLHRAEDYLVVVQLAGSEEERVSVGVNGRTAFDCALTQQPRRCEATVAALFFREGRNDIRVQVEPVTPATRDVRLYSLELIPKRNASDSTMPAATTPAATMLAPAAPPAVPIPATPDGGVRR